jgi:hypothetical protein
MTTLTIEQLEKWYDKRLSEKSKEFVKQAEKSYKIVERALRDVEQLSLELKEAGDDDDSESISIATRFALKITDIVAEFDMKKKITYDGTELMQDEIQRFIQELWGAGARWIKRMDKKHKNTIKQLDVYMKELSREMKRIGKLLYEFSWLKNLERIEGRIQSLKELTLGRENFQEQIRQIQLKIETAQEEYERAKKAHESYTEESNVSELLNLDEESDHLGAVLRMKLNPLKKQVKKFLQRDTGVRVAPDGQKALIDYFEDPLTAITVEPEGHPALIAGLLGLKEAIETNKLKLKDRLARRALEEIEAIESGSLIELQQQAKSIEEKRKNFAGSDVYSKSQELEENLDEAIKNLDYHKSDLLKVRDDIERQLEKVQDFKKRIETEIKKAFEEKITIEIGETLEPLLDECVVD